MTVAVALLVSLGLLVFLVIAFVAMYNGLVALRMQVKNAWAQIDVQLKRRYDLIPNLVETVKGAANFEKSTLESVMKARNACMSAQGTRAVDDANNALTGTLRSLFAVVEAYPDLKTNANYTQLQETLVSMESKIAFSRQFYNDSVARYNATTQSIPNNFVASLGNFQPADMLAIAEAEKQNVKVQF